MSPSIWGASHDEKMANFEKDVAAIQAKHHEIFDIQVNRLTGEAPDDLDNHFLVKWDVDRYRIWFDAQTYIPEFVQEKVIEAFRLHFEDR